MKIANSKLVLGLLAGTAVVYLCTTDKKEKWLENATSLLEKAKNNLKDVADSAKEATNKTKCNCEATEVLEATSSKEIITE